MANRRILITGGAGYIGSHMALAALEAGHEVAIIDDLSSGILENAPPACAFHQLDIANDEAVLRLLRDFLPNAVMHFAGSIVVPESVLKPEKYYRNNSFASLSLLENCLKAEIEHFVFSSTAAVYGLPEEGLPEKGLIDEKAETKPINPYGWSKLMTEQILADLALAHSLCYASLRYFNVAGADAELRTGQSTPEATHLIKVACETALGLRPEMKIFGTDYDTPDGTCIRDFIHVSDLARAHLCVLDYICEKKQNLVLNCGNGRGYSVREVIESVERVSGKSMTVREEARRLGDAPALIANPAALCEMTGFRAEYTDLDEIVKTALNWERKLQSKKN